MGAFGGNTLGLTIDVNTQPLATGMGQAQQIVAASTSVMTQSFNNVTLASKRLDDQLGAATARLGAAAVGAGQFGYSLSIAARAIPGLSAALAELFPLFAAVAFAEVVGTMASKFEHLEEEVRKTSHEYTELGIEASTASTQLEATNLKLEDTIAKIQGKIEPNGLAVAALEGRLAIDKELSSIDKLLERQAELANTKGEIGYFSVASIVGNVEPTTLEEQLIAPYRQALADKVEIQQQANQSGTKAEQEEAARQVELARSAAEEKAQLYVDNIKKQMAADKEYAATHIIFRDATDYGPLLAKAESELRQFQSIKGDEEGAQKEKNLLLTQAQVEADKKRTAELERQYDAAAKSAELQIKTQGETLVSAARQRGAPAAGVGFAEAEAERANYDQLKTDLEAKRALYEEGTVEYKKYTTELQAAADHNAAALTVIANKEREGVHKEQQAELADLEVTNRQFQEAMAKRVAILNRGSAQSGRLENAQLGQIELHAIEEQSHAQERLFSEGRINRSQEQADLQKTLDLLNQKKKAAEDAINSQIASLKGGQSDQFKNLGVPANEKDTTNQEQILNLQKELTTTQEQYKSAIDSTSASIAKLDSSWTGFFARQANQTLTAGVSFQTFANQFQLSMQNALTQINNQFTSSVGQWILHGGSFGRAMQNLGANLVASFAQSFVKLGLVMLETWIQGEIFGKTSVVSQTSAVIAGQTAQSAAITAAKAQQVAATLAGNAVIASSYIGIAGAAGVSSWAAAPWPIDAGAPAFGTAMAAAAAGFATAATLAEGGMVLGKGTSTSDSIPAMLSHGEFVVSAKGVAGNESLLQRINAGQKFSHGGFVGLSAGFSHLAAGGPVGFSSSGGNSTVNSHNRFQFQNTINGAQKSSEQLGDEMFAHFIKKLRRTGYNI
jgi:hypothetical protein